MNLRPLAVAVAVTLTSVAAACGPHEERKPHQASNQDIIACDRAVYGELIRVYPAGYLRSMAPCNHLTPEQWDTVVKTASQDAVNALNPPTSP